MAGYPIPKQDIDPGARVVGLLMILLGIFTISLSLATTIFTVVTIGIVLSFRGMIEAVYAFFHIRDERFWMRLFGGIFSLVLGILIWSNHRER